VEVFALFFSFVLGRWCCRGKMGLFAANASGLNNDRHMLKMRFKTGVGIEAAEKYE
jgi:hypothetical protein